MFFMNLRDIATPHIEWEILKKVLFVSPCQTL